MAKRQRYIIIDNYTNGLLEEIVNQGRASNPADAVGKSAAAYLGIHYKSKEERKLEQDATRIQELGRRATKEE